VNEPLVNLPYIKDGLKVSNHYYFQIIFESRAVLLYPILKAGRHEMLGSTNEELLLIA
jgi:hypothetical protein